MSEELFYIQGSVFFCIWLKNERTQELEKIPEPGVIMSFIVENLKFAPEQVQGIVEDLETNKETNCFCG